MILVISKFKAPIVLNSTVLGFSGAQDLKTNYTFCQNRNSHDGFKIRRLLSFLDDLSIHVNNKNDVSEKCTQGALLSTSRRIALKGYSMIHNIIPPTYTKLFEILI